MCMEEHYTEGQGPLEGLILIGLHAWKASLETQFILYLSLGNPCAMTKENEDKSACPS